MGINYNKLSNNKKVELLEATVLTGTAADVSEVYGKLGAVEMSARALGIACRFRGLDWVVALVNGGASFFGANFSDLARKYHCGYKRAVKFYDPDYSLMLLDDYEIAHGHFGFYDQHIGYKNDDGWGAAADRTVLIFGEKEYNMIPLAERIEIAKWLSENVKNSLVFNAGLFLFNALLTGSAEMSKALTDVGVQIDQDKRTLITTGSNSADWIEWQDSLKSADADELLTILYGISANIGEDKLLITQAMISDEKSAFLDEKVLSFVMKNCNVSKLSMKKIAEMAVDSENIGALSVLAANNSFAQPAKRDALIEYAISRDKTRSLAWLMDYKNKTANFAKEAEAAEKKAVKELTGPKAGSVEALKAEWSFKKQDDGTLILTGYKGNDTIVEVPSAIGKSIVTALNKTFICSKGYDVPWEIREKHAEITKVILPETIRSIGYGTFSDCANLTDVNIPDGVRIIDMYSFAGTGIEEVTVPGNVETIAKSAFSNCRNLKKVTVNFGVKSIGEEAFYGDKMLCSVNLPDGLTEIGANAFSKAGILLEGDDGLKYSNHYLLGIKGEIDEANVQDGTVLIADKAIGRSSDNLWSINLSQPETDVKNIKSIRVPGSVKTLSSKCFGVLRYLEKLTVEDGVEKVRIDFKELKALKDLYLPDSVTEISDFNISLCSDFVIHASKDSYAMQFAVNKKMSCIAVDDDTYRFDKDSVATEFNLEAIRTYIDGKWDQIPNALLCEYLGNKETVTIPDGVIEIGYKGFSSNKTVKKVILNQIEKIGDKAFWCCYGLKDITITDNVKKFGREVFAFCENLTSVTFTDGASKIAKSMFYECRGLTNVNISDTVTEIEESAFEKCTALTAITIPESVKNIGMGAFRGCRNLRSVTILGDSICVEKNAFKDCNDVVIFALKSTPSAFADSKPAAAIGFVRSILNGVSVPPEAEVAYKKYMSGQKKKLICTAGRHPDFMSYLLSNFEYDISDIDQALELEELGSEARAVLSEYRAKHCK